MLRLKDSYWLPIHQELQNFIWLNLFDPIFNILEIKKPFQNARVTALVQAIEEGRINYDNGVFSGVFDIRTSRELSEFATFSPVGKTWVGMPPPEIAAAALKIKAAAQAMNEKVARLLPQFDARVTQAIKALRFPVNPLIQVLAGDAAESIRGLAVMPDYTPGAVARLADEYNDAQRFNVQNWFPEEIQRLRDAIEKNVTGGYNIRELEALISSEWEVSQNKARFLARQETSLFVSKIRDERYQSAGIVEYIWMSSNDARCREANKYGGPAHGPGGPLHGKKFRFDDPPVSGTRGERENPGVPFGCRCIARPVLPSR